MLFRLEHEFCSRVRNTRWYLVLLARLCFLALECLFEWSPRCMTHVIVVFAVVEIQLGLDVTYESKLILTFLSVVA